MHNSSWYMLGRSSPTTSTYPGMGFPNTTVQTKSSLTFRKALAPSDPAQDRHDANFAVLNGLVIEPTWGQHSSQEHVLNVPDSPGK
jgi:hypothetical protein